MKKLLFSFFMVILILKCCAQTTKIKFDTIKQCIQVTGPLKTNNATVKGYAVRMNKRVFMFLDASKKIMKPGKDQNLIAVDCKD